MEGLQGWLGHVQVGARGARSASTAVVASSQAQLWNQKFGARACVRACVRVCVRACVCGWVGGWVGRSLKMGKFFWFWLPFLLHPQGGPSFCGEPWIGQPPFDHILRGPQGDVELLFVFIGCISLDKMAGGERFERGPPRGLLCKWFPSVVLFVVKTGFELFHFSVETQEALFPHRSRLE